MRVCRHGCDVLDSRVFLRIFFLKAIENFFRVNHKNYNFLDCDWCKKLLFSTYSLAKLLLDSLLSDSLLSDIIHHYYMATIVRAL